MNIGIHAGISGGLVNAAHEAERKGCTTFQIFTKSPQQWAVSDLVQASVDLFKEAVKKYKISPVVVHTSYLLNLASLSEELYKKSIDSFATEIRRAEAIGADYITAHIGSCGECVKQEALKRILEGIQEAVTLSKKEKINILFENSAKIKSPGGEFKDLAFLVKQLGKRYGITLDTCHAFAAGYDFREQKLLNSCINEVEKIAGSGKIKVVHLNDSKGDLGSGLDRHEHLGKGLLGKEGLRNVVNHPSLKNQAFILETPKEPEGSDAENMGYAKKLSIK
ncbi:MAG: hypothetical protein A2452_06205 [Candidatus Firestonebacteria bacterium RIFOXYC2_FULL_39_67]|nr:MAG: hypothetical protein A2536_00840 [Candidatus Firestonebacteria bacterium RIFOXYD2_FULL_39_29]OGF53815.1 MAG: hypothetical protein A2452_06205 [Candidatus Firestonebacteria bacterium RIFOXYC2_FULL_39_67]